MKLNPPAFLPPSCSMFACLFACLAPAFAAHALTGCVSSADAQGDVVERSAEARPAWAGGDFSTEGEGERYVLARKSGVTRLELGIKQAQAAAMDQSCRLAGERIRADLETHARAAGVASEALMAAIGNGVAGIEGKGHCPDAAPKFVYWELLRKDTADGAHQAYDVFVLLSIKKSAYYDALGVALDGVRASGAHGFDALAEHASDSYSEGN